MDEIDGALASPRLSPFAFPADTTFRFALLIVFVLSASIYIYLGLSIATTLRLKGSEEVFRQCYTDFHKGVDLEDFEFGSAENPLKPLLDCFTPITKDLKTGVLTGVGTLLALTFLIYWFLPMWKISREGLEPLNANDAREVLAELAQLCRDIDLKTPPRFLWNPNNLAIGASTFGRAGRYYVRLSAGLIITFRTDPQAFRAILAHELAHIRNGDVDRTYLTVALWWAFVASALLPFTIRIAQHGLLPASALVWRLGCLVILVYAIRNGVLRTREFYADVRASVRPDIGRDLRRVLLQLAYKKRGFLRSLAMVHPSPSARVATIDDTGRLFPLGWWDAVGTGIGVSLALPVLVAAIPLFFWDTFSTLILYVGADGYIWPLLTLLLPSFFCAALSIGVIGIGIWRDALRCLVRGEKPRSPGLLGLGFGIGIIAGWILSLVPGPGLFDPGLGMTDEALPGSAINIGIFFAVLVSLLMIGLYFVARWISVTAYAWLEISIRSRSPRKIHAFGLCIASLFLAVWLMGILVAPISAMMLLPLTDARQELLLLISMALVIVAINPVTIFTLICLWACPIATWLYRRRLDQDELAGWIFLDQKPRAGAPVPLVIWRPFLAAAAGLAAALLFTTVASFSPLQLPPTFAYLFVKISDPMSADLAKLVALASALQCLAAMGVAAMVARRGTIHGLCAAFVGGVLMSIVLLFDLASHGANIDGFEAGIVFFTLIYLGSLAALPATFATGGFVSMVRRAADRHSR